MHFFWTLVGEMKRVWERREVISGSLEEDG